MATRLGNYVTLPGSSTNWASGISDSLANLSKSYLTQAENELERDRLAQAAEESKRRFETTESRMRDAEARQLASDRANESYREQQLARQKKLDEIAALDRQRARDKENQETKNQKILASVDVTPDINFISDATRESIEDARKNITAAEKAAAENVKKLNARAGFLDEDNGLTPEGQAEAERLAKQYGDKNSSYEDRLKVASAAVKDLSLDSVKTNYEKEANRELNKVKAQFNSSVNRLPSLITQEEFIKAGQKQLEQSGHSAPYSTSVLNNLTLRAQALGLPTANSLVTAAANAAKQEYDINIKKLELTKDFVKSTNKGGKQGVSDKDFFDFADNLDGFGTGDRDLAINLYTTLKNSKYIKEANVPNGVLQQAIMLTSEGWPDVQTLNPSDPKDLERVTNLAIELSNKPTKVNDYLAKVEETLKAPKIPSKNEVLASRFNLDINKESIPSIKEFTREDFKTLSENLSKINQESRQTGNNRSSTDVSPTRSLGNLPRGNAFTGTSPTANALVPLPEVIDTSSLRKELSPVEYSIGPNAAKSRELVSLAEDINKDISFLSRPGRNSGVGLTSPLVLRLRNDLANKTKRLEQLKAELNLPR